jgi:hypothetical protein
VPPIGAPHLITHTDTQHPMDTNKDAYIITTYQVSTSGQPEFTSSKYFPPHETTLSLLPPRPLTNIVRYPRTSPDTWFTYVYRCNIPYTRSQHTG